MSEQKTPRPIVEAVTDATVGEFAAFLHEHLDSSRSTADWIDGLRTHWGATRPNYGYILRDKGRIVGGIGAIYADRVVHGESVALCNITSWCVLDDYRQQSMRLAISLVSQPGYHFTDFSPTRTVAGVLQFLKFRPIDERQAVIFNLPWFPLGTRILTAPSDIAKALDRDAIRIYRDHERFRWLRHVLVGDGDRWCHVIYKIGRFKNLPSARVIHVGDGGLTPRMVRRLCAHLLRKGMATSHIEMRFLPEPPWPARIRAGFIPKLFASATLAAADIDNLYSESVAMDL
jgi:hypothetical protein